MSKTNNIDALKYADESLRSDVEFMLEMIELDVKAFEYANDNLKSDFNFIFEAVKVNKELLKSLTKNIQIKIIKQDLKSDRVFLFSDASDDVKDDKPTALIAVNDNGYMLQYVSNNLKKDYDVVLKAISNRISSIEYANKNTVLRVLKDCPENIHNQELCLDKFEFDKDVVLALVRCVGDFYREVEQFHDDPDVTLSALRTAIRTASEIGECVLDYTYNSLLKDKDFALDAVKINAYALGYFSDDIKNDKDVVLEAVKQNGFVIELATLRFLQDDEILQAARDQVATSKEKHIGHFSGDIDSCIDHAVKTQQSHLIDEYEDNEYFLLHEDRDKVLEVLSVNGHALQFVNEDLKADEDVVLTAVRNLPSSFEYASDELKSNYQFVLKVYDIEINHRTYDGIQWEIYALRCCSDSLLSNKEFVIDLLQIQPNLPMNYVPSFMFEDADIILELIKLGEWYDFSTYLHCINSKKFMLKAIGKSANFILSASDELQDNKDFIIEAVKVNSLVLEFLDSKFKSDKDVVLAAVNSKNIPKVKTPSSYQEYFKKDRHNN